VFHPKVLGIIPARGGSKRLPGKNIRVVGGLPMIAHTILAAQQATLLTDFLVSSEDRNILETARQFGAPVPFTRPAHLAGDTVRNIDVVIHALEMMEQSKGVTYDMLVLLQPTSPVRDPRHIDAAVQLLGQSGYQSLASVSGPYKKRDPNLKKIVDGGLVDYCPLSNMAEWDPFYIYNGSIYATKRDYLLAARKLISTPQVPLVMDKMHSIDVDNEEDLVVAETLFSYRDRKTKG